MTVTAQDDLAAPEVRPRTSPRYVVITPAKNEEQHVRKTLSSMIAQTMLPARWVIVDDGSTDRTAEIVEEYRSQHPWITLLRIAPGHARAPGKRVVELFNEGFRFVETTQWDYVVKLDADLSFAADYFESLFNEFAVDPKLGIAGGQCYDVLPRGIRLERTSQNHVRGATKVYARQCFQAIGGLVPGLGWDGVDELKAQMLGWRTRSVAHCRILHHRPTGSAVGAVRGKYFQGMASYAIGYDPLYFLLRCAYRALSKPYLIGAAAMAGGFVSSYIKGAARLADDDLRSFVRRRQRKHIFALKREA